MFRSTAAVALALATSFAALPIAAGQEVAVAPARLLSVELASGRAFTGAVDSQTDDQRLVLRFARPGAALTRPIAWSRIVAARLDGQPVELASLRSLADEIASPAPRPEPGSFQIQAGGPETLERDAPPEQITTVAFEAQIANWDGDVETDGLVVDLYPLSVDGYLAPVSGTVEVELFAPQRRVFHHAPLSGGDTLEQVERWTRAIHAADFGPSGVRLRLPFGAVHPEFDLDWLSTGLVHVRLVAPGHGTFDDSRDAVRIRPFAPLRDQLEMNTGRRFVPTENVGRHD